MGVKLLLSQSVSDVSVRERKLSKTGTLPWLVVVERAKRPKLVKTSADSRTVKFTQVGLAGLPTYWTDLAMQCLQNTKQ